MAVGYHSRAFHGQQDPTSKATVGKTPAAHKEVVAAHDKTPSQDVVSRGHRLTRLRAKALSKIGVGE